MTKKIVTAVCALALGFAFSMTPAIAADESVKDKAKDKMDTAKDKMGNAVDKTKEKTSGAVEKTKEKTAEVKDKIKNKMSGNKGSDDVRHAQQALTEKGFHPGPVDGKMGPQTKAALSEFQKKENLKVTGRLDRETKDKLVNASVSAKTDTSTPAASPTTTAPDTKTPSGTSGAPAAAPSSGPDGSKAPTK
jgi:peptidoglycan hydrolase-like protein with peptidoglycan-binding domain